jgi:hypothetical protein
MNESRVTMPVITKPTNTAANGTEATTLTRRLLPNKKDRRGAIIGWLFTMAALVM